MAAIADLMAAVAPPIAGPVERPPSWRPAPSQPSAPRPAAVAALPLAAAVTTAALTGRRLGRRAEGRPVSVVVEETDRHDLEGAAWTLALAGSKPEMVILNHFDVEI